MRSDEVCEEVRIALKRGHSELEDLPELIQVLARAPAALKAYIEADEALAAGRLSPQDRSRIALAVSEINGLSQDSSAQARSARAAGLTEWDVQLARRAMARDAKASALLRFVQAQVLQRGEITDADFEELRQAGFAEGEIVEIVANVALSLFTNYLNLVAGKKPAVVRESCNKRP